MKIMDLPGEDSECQVEAVITSKSKISKQARLPFQTLSSDSPVANKKRELTGAADSRIAKRIKVAIKENACETLKKTEIEDSAVIEEIIVEEEEENKSSEADDEKDSSKPVSNEKQDSKNKRSTPSRGASKNKKSESKVPVNALTKFFKKVDNKDSQKTKDETQTPSKTEEEKSKKANDVNNTSDKISKTSKDQKNKDTSKNLNHDTEQKKEINKTNETIEITVESETESNKISEVSIDVELKDSFSSNENEGGKTDTSVLNRTENMDVDSDIALLSDDSHNVDDDDDDSGKSDTDSKRTEHEDTDSKDDINKSRLNHSSLSKQNKLLDSATKAKKLTPKQLERKLEIQKKRESREKQRSEREKKLQEERENRKKEKEEKRREREEKERLLKEQKKKEKELKEQKKQAEIEQKQKEKEAKEEDRRKKEEAKEEEKRRKEEERLEAEKKKLKAASNFVSFFVPKKPTETKPVEKESKVENRNFMPFEIKADMRVAPLIRRNLSESEKSKLDKFINSGVNKSELYISDIKNKFQIRKSERTWPYEANDDVVIIDEDEENSNIVQGTKSVEKHRAKLLLFHDNRRPPYWGTWRKKSKTVNPRRPLSKDTQWFDYEVDSDDEWEEEEPGESLHGSDDEKEKDEENAEENEYDVDNDFMVPHGYLSEEEIGADEEDEEDDDLNPEMQKKKLKLLGEQFEAERNTKTKRLKPKVIGCVWLNAENAYPENTPSYAIQFLTIHQAWVREIPLTLTAPADTDNLYDNENGTPSSKHGVTSSARKALALEEAMPDLIRMLHGNTHGRAFLVKEFLEYLSKKKEGEKPIPKAKLHQKIREIATWVPCREAGPMQDKHCWYVAEDLRTKYLGTEKLTMPNRWTYCLTPKKKSIIHETIETPDEKEKEKEKEKKLVPLITKFTKTITAEEMQKLLTEKPPTPVSKVAENPATYAPTTSASKPPPPLNRPPKRAALISVPRGESPKSPLPKSPRMSLMDKFLTNNSPMASTTSKKANVNDDDDDDDDDCCMIIDEPDEKEKPKPVLTKTDSANKTSDSVNEKSKNDQTTSTNSEVNSEKPEKAP